MNVYQAVFRRPCPSCGLHELSTWAAIAARRGSPCSCHACGTKFRRSRIERAVSGSLVFGLFLATIVVFMATGMFVAFYGFLVAWAVVEIAAARLAKLVRENA